MTRVFKLEEEGRKEHSSDVMWLKTQPVLAGFEGEGGGPQTKECRQPLEVRKCKESDSSLEPTKEMQPG